MEFPLPKQTVEDGGPPRAGGGRDSYRRDDGYVSSGVDVQCVNFPDPNFFLLPPSAPWLRPWLQLQQASPDSVERGVRSSKKKHFIFHQVLSLLYTYIPTLFLQK